MERSIQDDSKQKLATHINIKLNILIIHKYCFSNFLDVFRLFFSQLSLLFLI